MTKFRLRSMLAVITCLLMLAGCVVPGLTPASLPAPTVDTVLLFTMVAGTVAAANTGTAAALASISTSTPTLPPSTEESTVTSTAGVSLLIPREDGTTLFADQRASYEVIVPARWLAVRVNEQEYLDAWSLAETTDPAIQTALRSIETEDPNRLRLLLLDTQDGHIQSGVVSTIRFDWDEQDDMSLTDDADLMGISEALPIEFSGLEVLTTELRRTQSALPIGVITARMPTVTSDGNVQALFQEKVFVDLLQGTLTTTEEFIDVTVPPFDGMIESLAVIN